MSDGWVDEVGGRTGVLSVSCVQAGLAPSARGPPRVDVVDSQDQAALLETFVGGDVGPEGRRVGVLERLSFRVVRRPGSLVTSAAGSNKRAHRTTKRAPTGTHRTLTRKGARWECAQKVGSRKSRERRTKFEQRW